MVGENADKKTKDAIIQKYGLDKPLYIQYVEYLNGISPVGWKEGKFSLKTPELGISYQTDQSVTGMISAHWGGSAVLSMVALLFATILGVGLGLLSALWKDSFWDKLIISTSVIGISAPSFFVAVLVIAIFAVALRDFTHLDATGYWIEPNVMTGKDIYVWKNIFLPALALGIRPLAVFIQLTRSAMIEVLEMDYIRTAKAKGLSPLVVILRHALKNALNPVITSVTGWFASLLAGAFFVEYIFNWKGIGKLAIDALNNHDFPVILGCTLFIGVIFVSVNIGTDILYRLLDKRVKM
jgi:peptide/nickel transport system permease protein